MFKSQNNNFVKRSTSHNSVQSFFLYFYLVHLDLKVTLHFEQNIDGYNIVYDRAIIACMHTKQNKNIAYSLMIHFFRVKNIFSI